MITSISQEKERFDKIVQSFESCSKHSGAIAFDAYLCAAARENLNAIAALQGKPLFDLSSLYDEYKDELPIFQSITADLTELMDYSAANKEYTDYLGQIFHRLQANSKQAGQFFTPSSLGRLTANVVDDADYTRKAIAAKGYIKLAEPACGSGSMLLGYVSKIAKLGYNPQQVLLIDAWDIDQKCVNMCYLQLNLYGLRAAVTHGDTLANKVYAKHHTLMYILNGAIPEIRGDYDAR